MAHVHRGIHTKMFYCWFTDLVFIDGKYLHPRLRYNEATKIFLKYYHDMAENDFDMFFDKCLWPCVIWCGE